MVSLFMHSYPLIYPLYVHIVRDMNLEQPEKLCEVNNKSKCKYVTSYTII